MSDQDDQGKSGLMELARLIESNRRKPPQFVLVPGAAYDAWVAEFGAPPDGVLLVEDGVAELAAGQSLDSIFDGGK